MNNISKLEEATICFGWYDDAFIENPRGETCEAWTKESVAANDAKLAEKQSTCGHCEKKNNFINSELIEGKGGRTIADVMICKACGFLILTGAQLEVWRVLRGEKE